MHKLYHINDKSYTKDELVAFSQKQLENSEDWEIEIFKNILSWFDNSETIKFQSSGSTGEPRSITHSKESICASVKLTANYFNLDLSSRLLLCLSANYVAGKMMVFRALCLGCGLNWVKPNSTPEVKGEYDLVSLVPMQIEKLLELGADLRRVKNILIGGAPIRQDLKEMMLVAGTSFFESYGMTETLTHVAIRRVGEKYFEGLPKIEFETNNNTLSIKAPHISKAWIHTNDIVEMKGGSHFTWIGRKDDVINSGGVKLHPNLIEQKLESVLDKSFYVGKRKDELLGEVPVLLIESEEFELDREEIDQVLDKYEIPKSIVFVPKFERTFSGKIIRR